MIGQTISHYRILEKLGEGGMGVVYEAEDMKLKRTVALKFLPPELTRDPVAKDRFVREAQAASALDHPYIGTIYEINETEEGQLFIAMACYEGETLKQKIERAPLRIDEAIEFAMQVAEGLAKAHEQGIIHRDIKLANVMVTREGRVKILDFGLAKLQGQTQFTKAGTTLGTVAYISPEQLRGEVVDHRTDIWSLGVMIYEMVSGKLPFQGDYEQAVVYSILNEEPEPITALRTGVPMELERIVVKAIAKEPGNRYQHVDEIPVDLKAIETKPSRVSQVTPSTSVSKGEQRITQRKQPLIWILIGVIAVAFTTGATLWELLRPTHTKKEPIKRFKIAPPSTYTLPTIFDHVVALSPEGTHLVFRGENPKGSQLFLHPLDQLKAKPIPGTEGAKGPVFSPDGQWLGFVADGKLKKVSLAGGAPITICEAGWTGPSWGPNDLILFPQITEKTSSGLSRVSATGGVPQVVTIPPEPKHGELKYRWVEVLPGGKAALFTIWTGSLDKAQIGLVSHETGAVKVLIEEGTDPRYSSTGHLVYARANGSLFAVPFNVERLEVTGSPVPILDGVQVTTSGAAQFSFSRDGSLVYIPSHVNRKIVMVDRQGVARPLLEEQRAFLGPRFSPDGKKLAVALSEGGTFDIWIYDIEVGTLSRLTFEANNYDVAWTPDGKWVTFTSTRTGTSDLFWKAIDGSAPAEPLLEADMHQGAACWSPDSKYLIYIQNGDIWELSIERERTPRPLLQTPFNEGMPELSPDGRWLVYVSDESGRAEVFVQAFHGPAGKWQISSDGGTEPVWAPNGQELFYRNGDKIVSVVIETDSVFKVRRRKVLFEGAYVAWRASFNYDIHPDGEQFVMIKEAETPTSMIVVLNWFDELKRHVPGGK